MRVVFRRRRGGKLGRRERRLVRDLIFFCAEKFIRPDVRRRITVEIVLDGKLYETEKNWGIASWENDPRCRNFLIEVDTSKRVSTVFNTIAHEMVHIKQWTNREHWQHKNREEVYRFGDEVVDAKKLDYWDLPWEIEAHGRAYGLVIQWVDARGLRGERWVRTAIDKHAG